MNGVGVLRVAAIWPMAFFEVLVLLVSSSILVNIIFVRLSLIWAVIGIESTVSHVPAMVSLDLMMARAAFSVRALVIRALVVMSLTFIKSSFRLELVLRLLVVAAMV